MPAARLALGVLVDLAVRGCLRSRKGEGEEVDPGHPPALGLDPGWSWPEVAVFETVAVGLETDEFGVVDEPVDHRDGGHVVAEDFAPCAALDGTLGITSPKPGGTKITARLPLTR
jgi:hypothetical protein